MMALQQQQQTRQALMGQVGQYGGMNVNGVPVGGMPMNQMAPAHLRMRGMPQQVVLPPGLQKAQMAQNPQQVGFFRWCAARAVSIQLSPHSVADKATLSSRRL